jgi:hypothetical protein
VTVECLFRIRIKKQKSQTPLQICANDSAIGGVFVDKWDDLTDRVKKQQAQSQIELERKVQRQRSIDEGAIGLWQEFVGQAKAGVQRINTNSGTSAMSANLTTATVLEMSYKLPAEDKSRTAKATFEEKSKRVQISGHNMSPAHIYPVQPDGDGVGWNEGGRNLTSAQLAEAIIDKLTS